MRRTKVSLKNLTYWDFEAAKEGMEAEPEEKYASNLTEEEVFKVLQFHTPQNQDILADIRRAQSSKDTFLRPSKRIEKRQREEELFAHYSEKAAKRAKKRVQKEFRVKSKCVKPDFSGITAFVGISDVKSKASSLLPMKLITKVVAEAEEISTRERPRREDLEIGELESVAESRGTELADEIDEEEKGEDLLEEAMKESGINAEAEEEELDYSEMPALEILGEPELAEEDGDCGKEPEITLGEEEVEPPKAQTIPPPLETFVEFKFEGEIDPDYLKAMLPIQTPQPIYIIDDGF